MDKKKSIGFFFYFKKYLNFLRKSIWRKYDLKYKDKILTNEEIQSKKILLKNGSKIQFANKKKIIKQKALMRKTIK